VLPVALGLSALTIGGTMYAAVKGVKGAKRYFDKPKAGKNKGWKIRKDVDKKENGQIYAFEMKEEFYIKFEKAAKKLGVAFAATKDGDVVHLITDTKNKEVVQMLNKISGDLKEARDERASDKGVFDDGAVKENNAQSSLKTVAKTAKATKRTVKLVKRSVKVTIGVAKLAVKMAKLAKLAIVAAKIAVKIGVKVAVAIIKAIQIVAGVIAGMIGVKVVVITAVFAVVLAFVIAIAWLFSFFLPNTATEDLVSHARLIRELDTEVNASIQYAENTAYEVTFAVVDGSYYPITRLRTNIIHFFAKFMVLHDWDWGDTDTRSVEDDIRSLHSLTYSLYKYWEEIYVPVVVEIIDPYTGHIIEIIEYQPRDVVTITLIVFSLEEMFDILDFTEDQRQYVLEIIETDLITEHFPELRPYLLEPGIAGLSPEEIAYILEEIPLAWPTHYRAISSPFGWRYLNGVPDFHGGIDIPMIIGTDVFASMPGTVTTSAFAGNAGHMIAITSDCGRVVTRYLHLSERLVAVGTVVDIGDRIALSGNTGAEDTSSGHLHYDIALDGVRVDPVVVLP